MSKIRAPHSIPPNRAKLLKIKRISLKIQILWGDRLPFEKALGRALCADFLNLFKSLILLKQKWHGKNYENFVTFMLAMLLLDRHISHFTFTNVNRLEK